MRTDEAGEQLKLICEQLSDILEVIRQQEDLVESLQAEGRDTAKVERSLTTFRDIYEHLTATASWLLAQALTPCGTATRN